MPKLIDTHAHVNFNAFARDADEVVRRSLNEDIWMINVGSQSTTSRRALSIAERYGKGVYAAVGLHPLHLRHVKVVAEEAPFQSYGTAEAQIETKVIEETPQEMRYEDPAPEAKIDTDEIAFETREETYDRQYYWRLAESPKVVAIGETGLDYSDLPTGIDQSAAFKKREAIIEKQKEVFKEHLELADELNLPVILHCRGAYDDLYKILLGFVGPKQLRRRGVVHCFLGNWAEAQKFLDLGFLISFNGIITFGPRKKEEKGTKILHEVLTKIPLEKTLIETDCPYLTPVPRRGKRNEPVFVKYVAERVAEIRGLCLEAVAEQTTKNAQELFGFYI